MSTHLLDRLQPLAPHVLRVIVALVFVAAGVSKLLAPAETSRLLAEHAIPWPDLMGGALGIFEVVAGALLLAGRFVRAIAFVLAAHVLALAFVFHMPFGPSAGAAHAQRVQLAFDVLAVGALYAVATLHTLSRRRGRRPRATANTRQIE